MRFFRAISFRTALRSMPLWFAVVLAAGSGLVYGLAFPNPAWWPLAWISVASVFVALRARSFVGGLLIGAVFGLSFWLPLIDWLTAYLGPIPWLGLAGFQTLEFAVVFALCAWTLTHLRSLIPSPWIWVVIPLVFASFWTVREWLCGTWPWGGFAWARLAQSQVTGPFASGLSWLSTLGLGAVIAFTCAMVVEIGLTPGRKSRLFAPLVVVALLACLPVFTLPTNGSRIIDAIQGNTKSGLFDVVNPGDNLQAHTAQTLKTVHKPVDLIVWPENASDLDPLEDLNAAQALTYLSTKYDAPIVTGTITNPTTKTYFNSALVWDGTGVSGQYDKIHPVPFAEYMPARAFFHALVPNLVDMVTRDYSYGQRANVVPIRGVKYGLSICFDIVDDSQIFHMVDGGAQAILALTNNADFGHTVESEQQLEIARSRAIETGRYLVNISTVGKSAVIAPSGKLVAQIPAHKPGTIRYRVPLVSGETPAVLLGRPLFVIALAIALASISVTGALAFLKRRRRGMKQRQVRPRQ